MCMLIALVFWVSAQQEVETTPVTFYEADKATVVDNGESVRVMLEGGTGQVGHGVVVDTKNANLQYIEVHDEKKPFPPNVLKPYEPGKFLVAGEPGSVFWISIRAENSPPVWLSITVSERGPPQSGPGSAVYEWVLEYKPEDQKTAKVLADYYEAAVKECRDNKYNLAQSKVSVSSARKRAFLSLSSLSVDWSDFVSQLNEKIEPTQNVEEYLQQIELVVKALRE